MDPHAQENKSAMVEEVDVDIGFQVSNMRSPNCHLYWPLLSW